MAERPLTPLMRDILAVIGDDAVAQVTIYERLGRAQNIGMILHRMRDRGLIEHAENGWRRVPGSGGGDE